MTIRIGINACTGRMGQALLFGVDRDDDAVLSAAVLRKDHSWKGETIQSQYPHLNTKLEFVDDVALIAENVDVLIDFSLPDFSLETAQRCQTLGVPVVIGTTGFSYEQKQALINVSEQLPLLMAPNMSVGVTLSLKILELVSQVIGEESDIEIMEAHHRYKKDSPSGTALRMGEAIAKGVGKGLSEIAAFDRCGKDAIRQPGSIGFSAIRAGNIIGEHTALFAMAGEDIEITHKARDRQTFASGAIKAAKWLVSQPKGHYDMRDVLGIR